MTLTLAPPTASPRSASSRCYGQCTVLMRRGGGLTTADAALVTPYLPGTSVPYPDPLYGGPDATEALAFPVATGGDGVVALWADAPGRLELEAVHPVLGRARGVLDLEPDPDAAPEAVDAYTKTESDARYLQAPLTAGQIPAEFLTQSEGDARYALAGVTPTDVYTKTQSDARYPLKTDPDPYPQYLTLAELPPAGGGLATDPLADAKGDVFAASGNDAVGRLALGTDGHVLTADRTQTLGVKWAAAAGSGGGAGLPTTGGTMTGPIASGGAAVTAGGALVVTGSGAPAADARVYGAGSGAFAPTASNSTSGFEYGVRFTAAGATSLVAVRWYRVNPTQAAPSQVRLWDTTTGTAVWTISTPTEWTATGAGWKEHRPTLGSTPALVTGRDYVLSYPLTGATNDGTLLVGYVPVPDTGLAFVNHLRANVNGAYPTVVRGESYGLDAVGRGGTAGPNPAAAGGVRLPVGAEGRVAWRDAADAADHSWGAETDGRVTLRLSGTERFAVAATGVVTAAGYAGTGTAAAAGAVRLANGAVAAWRNAGNTADLTLTMNASDHLELAVAAGALTTSATGGSATALPAQPVGYLTLTLNGSVRRIPYYS